MAFKMKSGNNPAFKMMGSSPIKLTTPKDDKNVENNPNAVNPEDNQRTNPNTIGNDEAREARRQEVTNTGVTWDEAYTRRDMPTYGHMDKPGYVDEAKRQKAHYIETGNWDAPAPREQSQISIEERPRRTITTTETPTISKREVLTDRHDLIGDKKVTTTTDKITGDVTRDKEKDESIIEGPKRKTVTKTKEGDVTKKTKVKRDKKGNVKKSKVTMKDGDYVYKSKTKIGKDGKPITKVKRRKKGSFFWKKD